MLWESHRDADQAWAAPLFLPERDYLNPRRDQYLLYPENSVGNSRASNAPYVPASNLRLEFPLSEWRFAAKRHANDTSGPAQKRKRPRQKGISAPLTIVDITACRTRFRSS